jgi:hypothetical protein
MLRSNRPAKNMRFGKATNATLAPMVSIRLVVNVSNAAVRSQARVISLKDARIVLLTETSAANVRETMLLSMASAHSIIVPSLTSVASARLLVAQNAKKRLLWMAVIANVKMEIS